MNPTFEQGANLALAVSLVACMILGLIGLLPTAWWPAAPQLMADLWASRMAPFFVASAGLLGLEQLINSCLSSTRR